MQDGSINDDWPRPVGNHRQAHDRQAQVRQAL